MKRLLSAILVLFLLISCGNHGNDPSLKASYKQITQEEAKEMIDTQQVVILDVREWYRLQLLFLELRGKAVLDLGCGYGWHCKYAAIGFGEVCYGKT